MKEILAEGKEDVRNWVLYKDINDYDDGSTSDRNE